MEMINMKSRLEGCLVAGAIGDCIGNRYEGSDSGSMNNIKLEYPFVVKAGNYHGRYGKALIQNQQKEGCDLLFIAAD